MTTYYTGDNVNIRIKVTLGGARHKPTSATITVWDATGEDERVTDAAMAVSEDELSYQVAAAVTDEVGTYKWEAVVTFADSQGLLSIQGTFVISVRYP